jgi:hypothetical protein
MKKVILLMLITSCSTLQSSIKPLELRTYDICTDLNGFCYQYQICSKRMLGICIKHELATDRIDAIFKDKIAIKKLYDMNFILKVRKNPL